MLEDRETGASAGFAGLGERCRTPQGIRSPFQPGDRTVRSGENHNEDITNGSFAEGATCERQVFRGTRKTTSYLQTCISKK